MITDWRDWFLWSLVLGFLFAMVFLGYVKAETREEDRVVVDSVKVQMRGETVFTITHDGKIIMNSKCPAAYNTEKFIEAMQKLWPDLCTKRHVADQPAVLLDEGMGDHWP